MDPSAQLYFVVNRQFERTLKMATKQFFVLVFISFSVVTLTWAHICPHWSFRFKHLAAKEKDETGAAAALRVTSKHLGEKKREETGSEAALRVTQGRR